MAPPLHAASIRVPEDVFLRSAEIARRRRISFNRLVHEALERVIHDEEYAEMHEAGTLLGSDPAECDVEYAIHAQAEVMLRDEP